MEIEIKKLNYIVDNVKIINELNVNFSEKKIYTILGPVGSGKTSLANLLYGEILPTSGKIKYDNDIFDNKTQELTIIKIRKKIGKVNQDISEHLFFKSVKDEFLFSLKNMDYTTEKKEKKIRDSMMLVKLDNNFLYRDPMTLSSGELSKISLAKSLLINPKVLILDEPSNGLDIYEQKNLINIIKTIKRKYNKTIIIFSKNAEFANLVSDEVLILNNKKIIKQGDKKDILSNSKLLQENGINVPKIVETKLLAQQKNIKLDYRDDRNDLIKDILRNI